jgi:hypothetical protein
MWDYNRLNKRNIAICQRDGIDGEQQENYRDVGNDSPLFRYAAVCLWRPWPTLTNRYYKIHPVTNSPCFGVLLGFAYRLF